MRTTCRKCGGTGFVVHHDNERSWAVECSCRQEAPLPDPAARLEHLLHQVGEPGRCRGCDKEILWVTHRNGRRTPYTRDGLNHFIDCPAAGRFRRRRPA